jgi:hypothetical protein
MSAAYLSSLLRVGWAVADDGNMRTIADDNVEKTAAKEESKKRFQCMIM